MMGPGSSQRLVRSGDLERAGQARPLFSSGRGRSGPSSKSSFPIDAAAGDGLGFSVALSENTAVIGAFGDDDSGDGSGSAYVFMLGRSPGDTCAMNAECTSGVCDNGVCALAFEPQRR
jgi:hypothetical protein